MTARIVRSIQHMINARRIMALASVCLLLAGITGVGLAQPRDWVPQDATEFSTHLLNLNAMAAEHTSMQAGSPASQEFISKLDDLRAEAFAAEAASDARTIVQDANGYVTQLEGLRQLKPTSLMATKSE